jgi:tetratricopeptide (TPR) repeat protein
MQLLPTWLALRSHAEPAVRRLALASVTALGVDDPKVALAQSDAFLVARVLRAYASPPDFAAVPTIVRMVSDARGQVRKAARDSLARFGKNAIWPVRELYEEVSGQPADKSWSFERTTGELYTVLDRAQLEDAATLLARGQKALAEHHLEDMQRDYDMLLAKYPAFDERAKLAPGYAAIGGMRFAGDELDAALAAYRRAVRLDPSAPDAKKWRAQAEFVAAELALENGVIDLEGYARALTLDPELHAASEARDRLSGEKLRRAQAKKRWAAGVALVLLLGLMVLVLRARAATPLDAAPDADLPSA